MSGAGKGKKKFRYRNIESLEAVYNYLATINKGLKTRRLGFGNDDDMIEMVLPNEVDLNIIAELGKRGGSLNIVVNWQGVAEVDVADSKASTAAKDGKNKKEKKDKKKDKKEKKKEQQDKAQKKDKKSASGQSEAKQETARPGSAKAAQRKVAKAANRRAVKKAAGKKTKPNARKAVPVKKTTARKRLTEEVSGAKKARTKAGSKPPAGKA